MTRESDRAPWAERIPDAPCPMSVDQFEHLPQEPGWRYELVRGNAVRVPALVPLQEVIQRRVLFALGFFVLPLGLGEVREGVRFCLSPPEVTSGTVFVPDVAFVAAGRAPAPDKSGDQPLWAVAPDLAVEIARLDQGQAEMARKAMDYLQAGTRLVWILYPQQAEMESWQQGTQGPWVQTLKAEQHCDGGDVLPGFTGAVAEFFPSVPKRRAHVR